MSGYDTEREEAREVSPSRASKPDDLVAAFVSVQSDGRAPDKVNVARAASESNSVSVNKSVPMSCSEIAEAAEKLLIELRARAVRP